MAESFSQKEMMVRLMDKFDSFEKNMDDKMIVITTKLNSTHELASNTNGKVKLHTKLIFGLGGALLTMAGWIFLLK